MQNNKFTGGDNLIGIKAKLHEVLMQTELNNGKGAYEVNFAGGNSGISFGGNQMDLAHGNEKYEELFTKILENATDINGNRILSSKDNEEVFAKNHKVFSSGLTPEKVFGNHLSKVNEALNSDYGRSKINEIYVTELDVILKHVDDRIKEINYLNRAVIENSDEWRVRLADYHNQFRFDKGGKLVKYLSGKEVEITNYDYDEKGNVTHWSPSKKDTKLTKETKHLKVEGQPSIDDLIRFYRATDEYNRAPKGLENRLKKIDAVRNTNYASRERTKSLPKNYIIEVGDKRDVTIDSGGERNCLRKCLNTSFTVDLKTLKTCNVTIKFDDHSQVKLNGNLIHHSIGDGGTLFEYQKHTDGNYYIHTGKSEVIAETGRSHYHFMDIKNSEFLQNGTNNITLDVIVAHLGCAYIKVICEHY